MTSRPLSRPLRTFYFAGDRLLGSVAGAYLAGPVTIPPPSEILLDLSGTVWGRIVVAEGDPFSPSIAFIPQLRVTFTWTFTDFVNELPNLPTKVKLHDFLAYSSDIRIVDDVPVAFSPSLWRQLREGRTSDGARKLPGAYAPRL